MSKIDANRKVNTFHKIITPIIQDFMFDKQFGQIITHGDATCQEFQWESEAVRLLPSLALVRQEPFPPGIIKAAALLSEISRTIWDWAA